MDYDSNSLLTPGALPPKNHQRIIVAAALSILLITSLLGYLYSIRFIPEDEVISEEALLQSEISRITSETEQMPFVFTVVQNAQEMITLPPPSDSDELDKVTYTKLKEKGTVPESLIMEDIAFNLPFKDTTYGNYLNDAQDPLLIFQIHDELRQLTLQFNQQYNRAPLKDRISDVIQMAPLDQIVYKGSTQSVYPSVRAVEAYATAEIMSRIEPINADMFKTKAEELIQRGISYGLYGISDADAAKSLVQQYIKIYDDMYQSSSTEIINIDKLN